MIKKIMLIVIVMALLCMPALVWGAPYLVCDPMENVTHFIVTIDGVEREVEAVDVGDGYVILKYDLTGVSNGTHDVTVKAKNLWGQSVAVPFVFTREGPDIPANIG
ncbi:MAG: hypothetical protein KAT70_08730, partial [Thermoplasmata archaeon]|nr:hypothetical protein [Thermoplasmata archaeon]